MPPYEADLEEEAESLEKQANEEKVNKNFDLALLLLEDAKDIYLQLGFKGKIGTIERKIAELKRVIDFEKRSKEPKIDIDKRDLEKRGDILLKKAKNLNANEKFDEALKFFEEAYEIFEKLNLEYQCKQITWEINRIKDRKEKPKETSEPVSIAEKRKQKIESEQEEIRKAEFQKELIETAQKISNIEEKKLKDLLEAEEREREREREVLQMQYDTKKQHDAKKQELLTKEEKLRQLQEKKKQEAQILAATDTALEIAKTSLDNKNFEEAKLYYQEAIDAFTTLGWDQQVEVLKKELRNIDKYKEEHEKKLELMSKKRQEQEEEFQKRVDTILEEKKQTENEKLAKIRALPPEMKQKIQKAEMLLKKAEMEEKKNLLKRVLGRYQYILELYNSIPKEKVDLSNEISDIENKIKELEAKL